MVMVMIYPTILTHGKQEMVMMKMMISTPGHKVTEMTNRMTRTPNSSEFLLFV